MDLGTSILIVVVLALVLVNAVIVTTDHHYEREHPDEKLMSPAKRRKLEAQKAATKAAPKHAA